MSKVLIATVYNPDPVLLAAHKLSPDRLILLVDEKTNEKQNKALKLIKDSLGRVIDIKEIRTSVYEIVDVAKKCVEVIDMQPREDKIYVNITASRKTQALGLLYAAYARSERVRKIAYNPEEDKNTVVYLPKLSFKLKESQKKILDVIDDKDYSKLSWTDMAKKIGISPAMFYRNIDELKDLGFVETENVLELTDAGRLARL